MNKRAFSIVRIFADYFLLWVIGAMIAAALAGWFVKGSIGYAFLWGLCPLGAVIVLFILYGPISAVLEAMEGLKGDAAQRGWARALVSSWAWGLVSWAPPHALAAQFVLVWAAILAGVAFLIVPHFASWPLGTKAAVAAGLVFLAGAVNGAFRGAGR